MTIPKTIERWHRIALDNTPDELPGILDQDAVFESPVVFTLRVEIGVGRGVSGAGGSEHHDARGGL